MTPPTGDRSSVPSYRPGRIPVRLRHGLDVIDRLGPYVELLFRAVEVEPHGPHEDRGAGDVLDVRVVPLHLHDGAEVRAGGLLGAVEVRDLELAEVDEIEHYAASARAGSSDSM